jgi:hypothetical protein
MGKKLDSTSSIITQNIPGYTWLYNDLHQNSVAIQQRSNVMPRMGGTSVNKNNEKTIHARI